MKKLLPLLFVVALGACNRDDAPAPAKADPAAPAATAPAKDKASRAAVPLGTALPEGVTFGFPHNVLSDKTDAKEGRDRRTVRFESLGGGAKKAVLDVRDALLPAGFRPLHPEGSTAGGLVTVEGGKFRADFIKKGYDGRIRATATPVAKGKGPHPDATSVVVLTWVMPEAAPKAAAAATGG